MSKNDNCYVALAENAEFVGFFEEAIFALLESDCTVAGVSYWSDLDLASTHVVRR